MSVPNFQTSDTTVRRDATGRRKTKVLIVDDEPAIREVLEMILQEWGYDVRLATSVATALQAANSEPMDLLISDLGLPDGSGHDLMRQILGRFAIRGIQREKRIHMPQRRRGIARIQSHGGTAQVDFVLDDSSRRDSGTGYEAHPTTRIRVFTTRPETLSVPTQRLAAMWEP